jgi:hypothetical protein
LNTGSSCTLFDFEISTKKAEEILALVKHHGDTTRDYQHYQDFLIQSFVRDLRFKQEEMKQYS